MLYTLALNKVICYHFNIIEGDNNNNYLYVKDLMKEDLKDQNDQKIISRSEWFLQCE